MKKFLIICCIHISFFTVLFGQVPKDEPVLRRRPPAQEQVDEIDKAIAIEPENYELYLKKAKILCYSNDKDAALLNIETAIHLAPQNKWFLKNAGILLFKCGFHDKSLELADTLVLQFPDHVIGYRLRSPIRYFLKNYSGAIEDYIKGDGSFEDEFSREILWMKTLDELRDDKNIFRYYDELFKIFDKELFAYTMGSMMVHQARRRDLRASAAKNYFLKGRIVESDEFFKQMIEAYPSESTYEERAKIYFELNRIPEAFADINKAIKMIEEKQSELLKENKNSRIEDNLRYIKILNELKAGFYITRGDFYFSQKDFEKAISDYQTAISFDFDINWEVKKKIINAQDKIKEQKNKIPPQTLK